MAKRRKAGPKKGESQVRVALKALQLAKSAGATGKLWVAAHRCESMLTLALGRHKARTAKKSGKR